MNFNMIAVKKRAFEIVKARLLRQATLEEIGREHGITRERVRQILRRIVLEMEKEIQAEGRSPSLDDLSIRTRNVLWKAGYRTLREISQKSPEDLLRLRGFGIRSFLEVKSLLEAMEKEGR